MIRYISRDFRLIMGEGGFLMHARTRSYDIHTYINAHARKRTFRGDHSAIRAFDESLLRKIV